MSMSATPKLSASLKGLDDALEFLALVRDAKKLESLLENLKHRERDTAEKLRLAGGAANAKKMMDQAERGLSDAMSEAERVTSEARKQAEAVRIAANQQRDKVSAELRNRELFVAEAEAKLSRDREHVDDMKRAADAAMKAARDARMEADKALKDVEALKAEWQEKRDRLNDAMKG